MVQQKEWLERELVHDDEEIPVGGKADHDGY